MLAHDFWLVPETGGDYSYADFGDRWKKSRRKVTLHDDFVQYVADSLMWIPSLNPCYRPAKRAMFGLCHYGVTIINKKGAPKASRIFRLWSELFREGPPKLKLTGNFYYTETEFPLDASDEAKITPSSAGYEKITAERKAIVKTFQTLAEYADQAATGKFFILHWGI